MASYQALNALLMDLWSVALLWTTKWERSGNPIIHGKKPDKAKARFESPLLLFEIVTITWVVCGFLNWLKSFLATPRFPVSLLDFFGLIVCLLYGPLSFFIIEIE